MTSEEKERTILSTGQNLCLNRRCYGLVIKCLPQAHISKHLIPNWRHFWGGDCGPFVGGGGGL